MSCPHGWAHEESCDQCKRDAVLYGPSLAGKLATLQMGMARQARDVRAIADLRVLLNLHPQQDPEGVVGNVRHLLEDLQLLARMVSPNECPPQVQAAHARELAERILAEPPLVRCQCGRTYQKQSGWDAQGLFEDLPDYYVVHHDLTCCHVVHDPVVGTTEEDPSVNSSKPLTCSSVLEYAATLMEGMENDEGAAVIRAAKHQIGRTGG